MACSRHQAHPISRCHGRCRAVNIRAVNFRGQLIIRCLNTFSAHMSSFEPLEVLKLCASLSPTSPQQNHLLPDAPFNLSSSLAASPYGLRARQSYSPQNLQHQSVIGRNKHDSKYATEQHPVLKANHFAADHDSPRFTYRNG